MMKIAFVFPGQGSQYVGMGREIYEAFNIVRTTYQEASEVLQYNVADLSFRGPEEELNKTYRTQPCILTLSIAIHRILISKGINPSIVAGHSLGEYSALVAADVLLFSDALKITEKRGIFMQEAVPEGKGLMAAILGLERNKVDEICLSLKSGYAYPANYNCPGQIVISGEKDAVEEAINLCKEAGAKRAVPLTVSVPSHCKLMETASRQLSEILDTIKFKRPTIHFISNKDANFIEDAEDIKKSLIQQLGSPVLWEDSVRLMKDSGVDTFIEVGPGKVLSGLIRRIVNDVKIFNVEDMKGIEIINSQIKL
ncbi:MAG: ACP S-malonyltransferase [Nitrospirae bacterium]|nr:ACP S-malonyltransferase [Nitrospirota bacterium]